MTSGSGSGGSARLLQSDVASQAEALRRILESDRLDLHTGMPGRVRSFDRQAQTAEIELGLRRVIPAGDEDEDDQVEDYPILPDVPICYPRGGGFRISWPLSVGDHVWVMFSDGDLNAWRGSGSTSDPGVATRHGLSGAVCYPGVHHRGGANGNATDTTLRIEREGGPVFEIDTAEVRCGGSVALAEGPDVRAHLQAISTALAGAVAPAGGGAVTYGTPYVYATTLAGSPIDTTTTKGT